MLKRIINSLDKNVEFSAQMAAVSLLGYPSWHCSHKFAVVHPWRTGTALPAFSGCWKMEVGRVKVMNNMKQTWRIFVLMRNPFPHLRPMWRMTAPWQHHMLLLKHHKRQHISLQMTMAQCLRRRAKVTTILLWNT